MDGVGSVQRLDSKTVSYSYDAKTTLEYALTYTGFKEDIVVSSYTGQTEYTFVLETGGLSPLLRDGSYYLVDEAGTIRASIGDIIVFSADERNNTTGTIRMETITEKERYRLTIVLDGDYLSDPATLYPIRIDPTIDINYDTDGSGAIEDVTICSNVTPDGASTSLFVGLRETRGISRILMRFPNLDLSGMAGATVQSANVTIRDLMCEGTTLSVYCYPFTGASWTESTASWSMVQTWGNQLDKKDISYKNGAALSPKHRYSFDITAAVQGWINGTLSKDKGLIFKTSAAVETGSTYQQRQFASYNRTNYQPTFTMSYILNGSITSAAGNNFIKEGQSMMLLAHMNGNVTWASSNASVATVNASGVVSGLKAGSATITASCAGYADATFNVWVTIPSDVYFIKNASSGLCLENSGERSVISNQKTSQSLRVSQLWRITYVGSGLYCVRPMDDLAVVLTADSSKYAIVADVPDADECVSYDLLWSIVRESDGYAFRRFATSNLTLVPLSATTSGSQVRTDSSSGAKINQWALQAAKGVFLRNKSTLKSIPSTTTKYMTTGTSSSISALGMEYTVVGTASSLTWSSSNTSVATITSTGTSIIANAAGSTIIKLTAVIGGTTYIQQFTLNVSDAHVHSYTANSILSSSHPHETTYSCSCGSKYSRYSVLVGCSTCTRGARTATNTTTVPFAFTFVEERVPVLATIDCTVTYVNNYVNLTSYYEYTMYDYPAFASLYSSVSANIGYGGGVGLPSITIDAATTVCYYSSSDELLSTQSLYWSSSGSSTTISRPNTYAYILEEFPAYAMANAIFGIWDSTPSCCNVEIKTEFS